MTKKYQREMAETLEEYSEMKRRVDEMNPCPRRKIETEGWAVLARPKRGRAWLWYRTFRTRHELVAYMEETRASSWRKLKRKLGLRAVKVRIVAEVADPALP